MPYPRSFLRLVMSGTLYNGPEAFSYGLALIRGSGAGGPTAPTTVPTAVRTAVETFHKATTGGAAKLNMIKLNLIGTDGKYAQQQTVMHDYGTGFVQAAVHSNMPPQVALAVTLATPIRRGLARSGRFFLPIPQITLPDPADGRIPVARRDAITVNATDFIQALHTALPGWRVGVVSDVREGAQREVERVKVGRVVDTIRSRRTSLGEDYSIGTVVGGWTGGGGDFDVAT